MANRTLQLVKEFLFPDRVEHHAIPVLDGGLSANDELDGFDAVLEPGHVEPEDVIIPAPDRSGDIIVSAGEALWRCPPGRSVPERLVDLDGAAGPLAADADGALLVGVAGRGVARVDASGQIRYLATEAAGRALGCVTALTVAAGGRIFATEGSAAHPPDAWARDLLEKGSSGRLVEIDPAGGKTRVVADGLAWPHGVCPTVEGEGLLVTEAWRHRILRIDPGGGNRQVLRSNMAAYPAQIHRSGDGAYWLSFLSLRTHLVEFVLGEDEYRADMLRSIPPEFWIRPALRTTGERWEPLQIGQVKHLNVTKPWAPPRSYGLVARMEPDGAFNRSFHSRAGATRHGCLSARQYGDRLLVASKGGRTVLSTNLENTR